MRAAVLLTSTDLGENMIATSCHEFRGVLHALCFINHSNICIQF